MKNHINLETQYPAQAPKWAVHRIEIDLVADGFKGTVVKDIGGNCKGGGVLSGLVDELSDDFEPDMSIELNKKHCRVNPEGADEEGYISEYVLYNDNGESKIIGFDRIERHIIGTRIVDCWPEA